MKDPAIFQQLKPQCRLNRESFIALFSSNLVMKKQFTDRKENDLINFLLHFNLKF